MISWKVTKQDNALIAQIAGRAVGVAKQAGIELRYLTAELMMDLTATHANGCPLDLPALLAAEPFTFSHDVFGIHRHIDRTTGKLGDCFVPRLARRN